MTNITNIDRTNYVPPAEHDDPCDMWTDEQEQEQTFHTITLRVEPPAQSQAGTAVIMICWFIIGVVAASVLLT